MKDKTVFSMTFMNFKATTNKGQKGLYFIIIPPVFETVI